LAFDANVVSLSIVRISFGKHSFGMAAMVKGSYFLFRQESAPNREIPARIEAQVCDAHNPTGVTIDIPAIITLLFIIAL
jgi:hypothetical protein